jgi:hypothetical protein
MNLVEVELSVRNFQVENLVQEHSVPVLGIQVWGSEIWFQGPDFRVLGF